MYDLACSSTTEFFVATTGPVARQGSVAGLGLVKEIAWCSDPAAANYTDS